jgi:hypothetical protein
MFSLVLYLVVVPIVFCNSRANERATIFIKCCGYSKFFKGDIALVKKLYSSAKGKNSI